MKNFRAKYNILPNVGVRYAAQGEWFDDRKIGEVVIPMIAFIEGGMIIPMGTITRNFLVLPKSAQPKLPPPPPKSPPRAPQPNLPSRTEQPDPKRRREQKGKDVLKTRRPRLTHEEEAQRAAKQ